MERTNRPIQVETRAPAGRQQSRGVGQTGTGQDGQWADGLAREYGQKLSGRNPAAYEDGREEREPERQPAAPGGLMSQRGQGGRERAMGEPMGGSSGGRMPQGSDGRRRYQGTADGQAYGRNGYGRNGYGQGEQPPQPEQNRRQGPTTAGPMPYGTGPSSGSGRPGPMETLPQGRSGREGQRGYAESAGGYQAGQAGRADRGRRQPGETAGNTGFGQTARDPGNNGRPQPGAGAGNIGLQQPKAVPGNADWPQSGADTGDSGRLQSGAGALQTAPGAGNAVLQQTGTGAGSNARRQNAGTAGKGRGSRDNARTARAAGSRSEAAARSGGRQQDSKTSANDGRRRTNRQTLGSRKPPGSSSGKKGRFGSKAGAKGRTDRGQVYEDTLNAAGSVQSRKGETPGRQRTRQNARPPGYGSNGRRKPGSGVNFLVQGSILAAAGIIVRLIGMVYRIPLAKKIGDVGNGYYNAAYSIYSILLIMSSYSLPTAVSKMVSARLAKGQYRTSTRIFRASMFYATVAGMAGFCALWFGADYFASEIIKMPFSSYALKSLAPTIWIMAYLGVLRGYLQGHSTMIPTAVSQIFEQVVNAVISIVAASVLFDMGVKSNLVFHDTEYSYAFGAAGGAIGTGAGALTALVLFLLLTMGYVPTMRKQAKRERGNRVESYGAISQALFVTIVPIIISSAIYNISNVVDNSIFGHVMEGLGESSQTASQWGVYMGRYHMLFNIPVAIANSLSSSLIPSLSRAAAEKNRREILSKIGSAIRFSMIIAIPSAVGLTVLAGPVSDLLFSGMDNEMLIEMMAVGSSAVVFFSLSTVSNAILQGINRMQVPIINSAVSLAVHVGALYVMLRVFHMGIYSVVYANILFAALVCVLNAVSIARYTKYRQEIVKTFLIPCGASAAMGGAAWGIYQLCSRAGNAIGTAAAIAAAILVYFVLLIKLKGVDAQELRSMPGGTRLLGAARKLRLM